jgi:hypothetical protein
MSLFSYDCLLVVATAAVGIPYLVVLVYWSLRKEEPCDRSSD